MKEIIAGLSRPENLLLDVGVCKNLNRKIERNKICLKYTQICQTCFSYHQTPQSLCALLGDSLQIHLLLPNTLDHLSSTPAPPQQHSCTTAAQHICNSTAAPPKHHPGRQNGCLHRPPAGEKWWSCGAQDDTSTTTQLGVHMD